MGGPSVSKSLTGVLRDWVGTPLLVIARSLVDRGS